MPVDPTSPAAQHCYLGAQGDCSTPPENSFHEGSRSSDPLSSLQLARRSRLTNTIPTCSYCVDQATSRFGPKKLCDNLHNCLPRLPNAKNRAPVFPGCEFVGARNTKSTHPRTSNLPHQNLVSVSVILTLSHGRTHSTQPMFQKHSSSCYASIMDCMLLCMTVELECDHDV